MSVDFPWSTCPAVPTTNKLDLPDWYSGVAWRSLSANHLKGEITNAYGILDAIGQVRLLKLEPLRADLVVVAVADEFGEDFVA